jgi:hypothetical protein
VTYLHFRDTIRAALARHSGGLTWRELDQVLHFSSGRPCPEWVRRLETEIGLVRQPGPGRALVWKLRKTRPRSKSPS